MENLIKENINLKDQRRILKNTLKYIDKLEKENKIIKQELEKAKKEIQKLTFNIESKT
jgi:ribosome recycling factor